jgi:hypothetical protein
LRVVVFAVGVSLDFDSFDLDFDSSDAVFDSSAGVEAGAALSASDFDADVAAGFDLLPFALGAFPKADTAFPKTRNAERQVAERDETLFRATS